MRHTPGPWKLEKTDKEGEAGMMITRGSWCIASLSNLRNTAKADGEYIVHCVNTHAALVEALTRLLRVAYAELIGKRDDVLDQAREALTKEKERK